MGCDIHSFVEVRKDGVWELIKNEVFPYDEFDKKWFGREFSQEPIRDRNYSLFGWLADVRNRSMVTPISQPKGLPNNVSNEIIKQAVLYEPDGHSHSWLSLKELLEVDYDTTFEDKRSKELKTVSLREHLGNEFFSTMEVLKTLGRPDDVRVVFWFDN